MAADVRPAVPRSLPRVVGFRTGRERLVRFVATAITALTALIAVVVVSTAAVLLGLG